MCLTACCLLSRQYIGVDIVAVAFVLQRTEMGCMFHLMASQGAVLLWTLQHVVAVMFFVRRAHPYTGRLTANKYDWQSHIVCAGDAMCLSAALYWWAVLCTELQPRCVAAWF
jgi:hypothetical protein